MPRKLTTTAGTETDYKGFLNCVDLYGLGLDSLHSDIKREAYAVAHADSSAEVLRFIESGFLLSEFTKEHFDVQANFNLRVRMGPGKRAMLESPPLDSEAGILPEDLLCIRTSFTAHFHCEQMRSTKKHAERFAQSEARLIFWPYFRQIISDTTARMSIRPITVPLKLKP